MKKLQCTFCNHSAEEVQYLIASPVAKGKRTAYICEKCVVVCIEILRDKRTLSFDVEITVGINPKPATETVAPPGEKP